MVNQCNLKWGIKFSQFVPFSSNHTCMKLTSQEINTAKSAWRMRKIGWNCTSSKKWTPQQLGVKKSWRVVVKTSTREVFRTTSQIEVYQPFSPRGEVQLRGLVFPSSNVYFSIIFLIWFPLKSSYYGKIIHINLDSS